MCARQLYQTPHGTMSPVPLRTCARGSPVWGDLPCAHAQGGTVVTLTALRMCARELYCRAYVVSSYTVSGQYGSTAGTSHHVGRFQWSSASLYDLFVRCTFLPAVQDVQMREPCVIRATTGDSSHGFSCPVRGHVRSGGARMTKDADNGLRGLGHTTTTPIRGFQIWCIAFARNSMW